MRRGLLVMAGVVAVALLTWLLVFAPKPTAPAALGKKWHEQMYGLDEGEVLRLIVAPYPPKRDVELLSQYNGKLPPGIKSQLVLHKRGEVTERITMAVGPSTIDSDIGWCAGLQPPRLEMVGAARNCIVDGDWFLKSDESVERRVAALESIFRSYTRRPIVLEQRVVEREVVVVSGQWKFKQLELSPHVATGVVAVYGDGDDFKTQSASGRSELEGLLKFLEVYVVHLRVLDEVKGARPESIEFKFYMLGGWPTEWDGKRERVLKNLEAQTGLTFAKVKRNVPVWFVDERGASTQPGAGR